MKNIKGRSRRKKFFWTGDPARKTPEYLASLEDEFNPDEKPEKPTDPLSLIEWLMWSDPDKEWLEPFNCRFMTIIVSVAAILCVAAYFVL